MSQEQLDKLVTLLRSRPPPEPPTVEAFRARTEEMGDRMPAPPEAIVEKITVAGRPAEWVSAPGCNPNRQALYLHHDGIPEIRTLRDHDAHEKAAIRAAHNAKMVRRGDAFGNQILTHRNKVIIDPLALPL